MRAVTLRTPQLLLREWRDDDLAPFAALNADAEVMRHFPNVLTRTESDEGVARIRGHFERYGYGLWAAEHEGAFIGFIGLNHPRFTAHFTPCVELGWRLARAWQGRGLATEGAAEVLRWALEHVEEPLVSFTVPGNVASRRVMEKLGLVHDERDDFEHPNLAEGHPLRRHVLYRVQSTKKSGVGSTAGSTR